MSLSTTIATTALSSHGLGKRALALAVLLGSLFAGTLAAAQQGAANAAAPEGAEAASGAPASALPSEPPADEAAAEEAAADEAAAEEAAQRGASAAVLPDSFDALRPIHFFQGQASGVVPDSFRPITISQLDARLQAQQGPRLAAAEKPQLSRAVYVAKLIDNALVSTQSTWEISYSGDATARLVLGELGLALQSVMSSGGSSIPFASVSFPVVTDPQGKVSVAVEGDTQLLLAWSAAGQVNERETLFDLAIPRAGQTRWLIEVPPGLQIQPLDGVGRWLPSPPPEAGTRDLDRAASWFALDAGGLSRVRLRVLQAAPPSPAVAVRQASLQYELAPAAMRFTARLVIDPLADRTLPPIQITGGRITSVSIDGSSVPWTETSSGGGRLVRVESGAASPSTGPGAAGGSGAAGGPGAAGAAISGAATSSGAMSVTLDGEAAWGTRPGPQQLPWLQLRECHPILIGDQMQAKVLIDSRLSLPRMELPAAWRYTAATQTDERQTTYRLAGPWSAEAISVRAAPDAGQLFAESLLRISATESRLRAVSDISVAMAAQGPQPVRLRIEPGWVPEVVLLPQSGRTVDLPHDVTARRNLTIWPTADELREGHLVIRVIGSQPLPTGDFARYPTTSFLSLPNCRHRCAAVVTPPPGFRWTADASLRTHRLAPEQLSAQQRQLLGDLPAEALLLDISETKLPPLGSRRPAASFRASTLLRLELANQRLIETYTVHCQSASGELNQIRIEFAAGDRPDIQWSVLDRADPARRLIRARRLQAQPAAAAPRPLSTSEGGHEVVSDLPESVGPREVWELELERANTPEVVLVGRREHRLTPPPPSAPHRGATEAAGVRIDLPSVAGASTRVSQVWVEPSLTVLRCSDAVLRVPQLVESERLLGKAPSPDPRALALRYDSTAATWIEVRPADAAPPVPVLWQETVRVVTSGRGGDWIAASYSADADATLVLDHEPGLRLIEVTDQQGTPLDYDASAAGLSVKTLPNSTGVNVQWARPPSATGLWRTWTPPRIAAVGVVLRRDWQVTAAPDTLIPRVLLPGALAPGSLVPSARSGAPGGPHGQSGPGGGTGDWPAHSGGDFAIAPIADGLTLRLDPTARQPLWLVDRSLALSLLAASGALLFGLAWWVAASNALLVAVGLIVSVLLMVVLPAGWFYWIAGVCMPIAAGALIGTTLRDRAQQERGGAPGSSQFWRGRGSGRGGAAGIGEDVTQTLDGNDDPSSRSLLGHLSSGWFLAVVGASALARGGALPAVAEEAASAPAPPPRPTVLIPTRVDGSPAGDKVYISQNFFTELFRDRAASASAPLITSALYRLRLDGMSEAGMPSAEWEVRYTLADVGERAEVLLPFRPGQVRSVQWLVDGEAKPLRWSGHQEAQIRVALPPGPAAALLLRLTSEVETPEPALRRIRLNLPAVASASLVVDSSSAVQRFELAGALGQTISQPDVGRLSAALGAVSGIDLQVTLRQGVRGIPAIAARRYWVHASKTRCQVECEVDPAEEGIRRGSDVPVVVLGGLTPVLTSADWTIQAAEMLSPRRQLLTFRAQRDAPEPIRLLWEMEAAVAAPGTEEEAAAIALPEVISAGSARTPDALIALHAPEGLQLVAQSPAQTTGSEEAADAVDAFIASWKGYRGTAQQVVRSPSPLARLVLRELPSRHWQAEEQHHLHVRPGAMRLTYDATLTRGQRTLGPLRVILPASSDLRELRVNGRSVASAPQRIGNRLEVAVPEPAGTDKIRLQVITHHRLSSSEPFQPPRVRVQPIPRVSGSYTITRNQLLRVEQVSGTALPEMDAPPLDIADQLHSGWIPCWTWRIDEEHPEALGGAERPADLPAELPGAFRIAPQPTSLDVVQKTAVRWRESRWMVDAVIRVQARSPEGEPLPLLDDVNVELPTAWSDQLRVEPAEAWSSQPAIDPAMRVIRIRPDAASRAAGVATIRIQGTRVGEADSLLEVPNLQLLAAATRRAYFVVPQAIGGRPLAWKPLSAAADQLPEVIAEPGGDEPNGNGDAAAARPQTPPPLVFRALSNAATVRLEPSRAETTVAQATVADIQLFPQRRDQWLAIIRWDLEPGDRDQVAVRVPAGATPIAFWTAGKPFAWKERGAERGDQRAAERGDSTGETAATREAAATDRIIDVTLSLSRLAQPLVMLCRLQGAAAGSRPELPTLRDTEVEATWLSLYQPSPELDSQLMPLISRPDAGWHAASPAARLTMLGQSVLKVTERSIGGATDRPQEEVVSWLRSWDERLAKLKSESRRWAATAPEGAGANATEPADSGVEEEASLAPEESLAGDDAPAREDPWEALENRWRQYTRRLTGGEAPLASANMPALMPAGQWQVALVARYPGAAEQLPLVTIQDGAPRLALIINLVVAGVIVVGMLLLAWRFRLALAPLLAQPACWLFAVGFASLAVAPTPVALAILLVAVTAPLLSGRAPAGGRGAARESATPRATTRSESVKVAL